MHDWILKSISIDWGDNRVVFLVSWNHREKRIVAEGFSNLNVPHREEWGRSVSINRLSGPSRAQNGKQSIEIEMQSGDTISVIANSIEVPSLR
jgi:hypothetical protein